MRRAFGLVLMVVVLVLLVAPLVRGAQTPCGMCASRCCCRPPRAAGERPAARLSLSCAGGGSAPAAAPALWPPARIPELPVPRVETAARRLPAALPAAFESLSPDPPVPPPRTV